MQYKKQETIMLKDQLKGERERRKKAEKKNHYYKKKLAEMRAF